VTVTNLNAILWQVRFEREHFTGIDVWIMSLLEGLFQFF
jgi:hypothetical protein